MVGGALVVGAVRELAVGAPVVGAAEGAEDTEPYEEPRAALVVLEAALEECMWGRVLGFKDALGPGA